jgi:hypothetical protein
LEFGTKELAMRLLTFVVVVAFSVACGPASWTPVEEDAAPGPAEASVADAASEASPPDAGTPFGDASVTQDAGKPVNLIPNGDFELGNVLFGSDYAYAKYNSKEGEYTVGKNPQDFNGALVMAGDHGTGFGSMFIGNGAATPDRVWFVASIAVQPSTTYYFEAWVMNLCCSGSQDPVGPSVLSFYANGTLLGTRSSTKIGVWEGLTTTWSSDSATTTVDLQLVNANTVAMGNDFAVDDVYLGTVSTVLPPN